MRGLIKIVKKDIDFVDIPLAFIFSYVNSFFKEENWELAENLGMTEKFFGKIQDSLGG